MWVYAFKRGNACLLLLSFKNIQRPEVAGRNLLDAGENQVLLVWQIAISKKENFPNHLHVEAAFSEANKWTIKHHNTFSWLNWQTTGHSSDGPIWSLCTELYTNVTK